MAWQGAIPSLYRHSQGFRVVGLLSIIRVKLEASQGGYRVSDIETGPVVDTSTMDARLDGGYSERAITKRAWRCLGCGRLWSRRYQAEDCESRGHVDSYVDTYYGRGYMLNGVFQGRVTHYTRRCLPQ